jgi:asparagine synthase (glutamine-hydrolysing)
LYPYMDNIQKQPEAYLRAFFRTTAEDCANPFFSHLPRWSLTSKLRIFYADDFKSRVGNYDPIADLEGRLPDGYGGWDGFSRAQYLEMAHLLPGYILSSQGDRMGMGHSVEGRFPFLDHRVVQFASRLSPRAKMRVLNEKAILKQAVQGLIPETVRQRKKQPYRAPDAKSFFTEDGRLLDYAADALSTERLRENGVFNPLAVKRLVSKAATGQAFGTKDNMALVGILSTQMLIERFIRNATHDQHPHRSTPVRRRQLPVWTDR